MGSQVIKSNANALEHSLIIIQKIGKRIGGWDLKWIHLEVQFGEISQDITICITFHPAILLHVYFISAPPCHKHRCYNIQIQCGVICNNKDGIPPPPNDLLVKMKALAQHLRCLLLWHIWQKPQPGFFSLLHHRVDAPEWLHWSIVLYTV